MKLSYRLYHKEISYIFAKTLENRNTKWDCREQQLEMDDFQKYSRLSTVATACPKYSQVPNVSIKMDLNMTFYIPLDWDLLVTSFKTFRNCIAGEHDVLLWIHSILQMKRNTCIFKAGKKKSVKFPLTHLPFHGKQSNSTKTLVTISNALLWTVLTRHVAKSWTTTVGGQSFMAATPKQ